MQDLLLASIKAELSYKIGGTDQRREVQTTEACPIGEDKSYILQLEQEVQSAKSMVNSFPNLRASHSSQLQVERDEPFDCVLFRIIWFRFYHFVFVYLFIFVCVVSYYVVLCYVVLCFVAMRCVMCNVLCVVLCYVFVCELSSRLSYYY